MQKPKQKHASSNAWSVVMQVTRRFVDYLSQVFLAMVIPLSRHQFHGWISFAFMFWFVLASGAVFGSLMWYFLIDCQVTSSIMDFIEASGMLQGSSTNICKSSAYIGLLDPCAYSEHHICGAVVKKRHETDCTEFSTDYVGYNNGTNICGYLTSSAVFKCAFSFDNETCGPDSIDYVASYMPFWMSDDDASVFNFEAGYVIPCVLEGMTCDDYANFHPDKYCGTKTCKNNRFCSASIGATYTGSLGSVEHYSCNTVSVAFVVAM
ncbi:hypothetical protein EON65_18690 [archaeon]|nr:MAG: hypothetical protein EON65_18690 [archaeon]